MVRIEADRKKKDGSKKGPVKKSASHRISAAMRAPYTSEIDFMAETRGGDHALWGGGGWGVLVRRIFRAATYGSHTTTKGKNHLGGGTKKYRRPSGVLVKG